MRDRYESLQPQSLIASMASMPRRWKDAIRVPAPKNIEDYFTMDGPDGTAAEHTGAAIAQLRILSDAIRTTSYNVPEPLPLEAATAALNSGTGPWPADAAAGLADMIDVVELLHEQLNRLNPHDWNKSADAGSTTLSVLALCQGASRVAADRLAIVERTIRTLSN